MLFEICRKAFNKLWRMITLRHSFGAELGIPSQVRSFLKFEYSNVSSRVSFGLERFQNLKESLKSFKDLCEHFKNYHILAIFFSYLSKESLRDS